MSTKRKSKRNVFLHIRDRNYGIYGSRQMVKRCEPILYQKSQQLGRNDITNSVTACVTFNCDGTLLAASHGGAGHYIRLIDVFSGKTMGTMVGHARTAWALAFSQTTPHLLASGCIGCVLIIWDCRSMVQLRSTTLRSPVSSLAFHPFNDQLIITSGDQTMLLNATDNQGEIQNINFSRNVGEKHIGPTPTPLHNPGPRPHSDLIRSSVLSQDGIWFGIVQSRRQFDKERFGTLIMWDLRKKKVEEQPSLSIAGVSITCLSCRVAPNSSMLTAAVNHQQSTTTAELLFVSLESTSLGQPLFRYQLESFRLLSCLEFSNCSNYVALSINSWPPQNRPIPRSRTEAREVLRILRLKPVRRNTQNEKSITIESALSYKIEGASGNDVAFNPKLAKGLALASDRILLRLEYRNDMVQDVKKMLE